MKHPIHFVSGTLVHYQMDRQADKGKGRADSSGMRGRRRGGSDNDLATDRPAVACQRDGGGATFERDLGHAKKVQRRREEEQNILALWCESG